VYKINRHKAVIVGFCLPARSGGNVGSLDTFVIFGVYAIRGFFQTGFRIGIGVVCFTFDVCVVCSLTACYWSGLRGWSGFGRMFYW